VRLILCIKRDLHGAIFLNHLLPQLAGHVVEVLLSNKVRPAETAIPALAEIAFLERTLPLERVFPLIDRSGASGEWLTFQAFGRKYGFDYRIIDDINSPEALAGLQAFAPDLIISARFSHIFKPPAISIPRHGIVNIHPGALPEFAGLFAPMRSIAAGRRELTCSLHFIDAGIDSGPLIATASLAYGENDDLLARIAALYPCAIPPLLDAIATLERGEPLQTITQDRTQRHYRSIPDVTEIESFLAQGQRFWQADTYDALLNHFMPDRSATTIA
jgi:methionyl-tRNA formyltransferase